MLKAERFKVGYNDYRIHLIREETLEVFEFDPKKIPFRALRHHGIFKKQIIEALKNIK